MFAGLARILAYLPEDHHMRPKYLALYRDMAASLAGRQGQDGLWRMNLDDAEEYPQPETSGDIPPGARPLPRSSRRPRRE